MITVTYYTKSKLGFTVEGHANYKKHGADIVCSAVTALVHNMIDSVMTLTDEGIDALSENSGFTSCFFKNPEQIGNEAKLLYDSMQLGLSSIETHYKKYIQIIEKEV